MLKSVPWTFQPCVKQQWFSQSAKHNFISDCCLRNKELPIKYERIAVLYTLSLRSLCFVQAHAYIIVPNERM